MKRYLIYILLIISSICYGQIYNTANSNIQYNNFQTTNYYNQPIRENSYENYNNSKFGYRTSTGYSTYKEDFKLGSICSGETYYTPSYSRGPKRVSGTGWLDWIMWGVHHDVPSSASNEDMNAYYNAWKNNKGLSWEDWYSSAYGSDSDPEGPPSPENPYANPIGEFPIGLLLILLFSYLFYKVKINNKRTMKL